MEARRGACWPWEGGRDKKDYGVIWRRGRHVFAHRHAWAMWFGSIPEGLCVLHKCDNPPCVNPWHLFLGTRTDNVHDCIAKGRRRPARGDAHGSHTHPESRPRGNANGARTHPETRARGDTHGWHTHPEKIPRGEAHGQAKITEKAVIEMRRLCAAGMTFTALGKMFSVGRNTAQRAVTGKNWAHVPRAGKGGKR